MLPSSTPDPATRTGRLAALWFAIGGSLYVTDMLVVNWRDLAEVAMFGCIPWILLTTAGAYAIPRLGRNVRRLLVALFTIALGEALWLISSGWRHGAIEQIVVWSHVFLFGAMASWLVSYGLLVRLVFNKPLSSRTADEVSRSSDEQPGRGVTE